MIDVKKVTDTLNNRLNSGGRISAWNRGVILTAIDIVEYAESFKYSYNWESGKRALLNGATSICEYTEGGMPLVYDYEICRRFSTPSEIRRTREGMANPNSRESWLDVMARGNEQAFALLLRTVFHNGKVKPEFLTE